MISFTLFLMLYTASLVLAMLAGLVVLVGYDNLFLLKAARTIRSNAFFVVVLMILPLAIIIVDALVPQSASSLVREDIYTSWLYQLGGSAVRLLQNRLNYGLLTDIFVVAYVWIFTFVSFFSPILLLARNDSPTLRRYSIALMFNYLILLPFVIFFPVSVPSGYPESGITPLLYVKSNWGRMVTSIDPLNNGFPSGHTSLCVTTALTFAFAGGQYRRYAYFLVGAAVSIIFSVLYLGIHWPMDVVGGFLVGVFAVSLSRTRKVEESMNRFVGVLLSRLPVIHR